MNRGLIALIPEENFSSKASSVGNKTELSISTINSDIANDPSFTKKKNKKNKRRIKREVKLKQLAFAWKLRHLFKYNAAIYARFHLIHRIFIHFFIVVSAAYSTWYAFNQMSNSSIIEENALLKQILLILNYALPLCAFICNSFSLVFNSNIKSSALDFAAKKLESLIFKQRFDSCFSPSSNKKKGKHHLNQSSSKVKQTKSTGKNSRHFL
jgi:hypothetical protein